MFTYSSNSPYYLDYIASTRTRQEILDDPDLCHILENPATKDNMEMALRFKEAKRGGYEEKKNFIEYFLANGPELEPDTILYYREKCYQDPIYLAIANVEFNNIEIIDEARITKYNKSMNLGDCYSQPCNYLGPMSSSIGMMGDSKNFLTLTNIFAKNKTAKKDKDGNIKYEEESAWGHIREHVASKIIPNIRVSCQMLHNNMLGAMQDYNKRLADAGIVKHVNMGDPVAINRAEMLSAATKINTYSRLGDCARMWQHLRTFNPYDPQCNYKGPIASSDLLDNKETNGTSKDNTPQTPAIMKAPESVVKKAAASGSKSAKALRAITNTKQSLTIKDLNTLISDQASDAARTAAMGAVATADNAATVRNNVQQNINAHAGQIAATYGNTAVNNNGYISLIPEDMTMDDFNNYAYALEMEQAEEEAKSTLFYGKTGLTERGILDIPYEGVPVTEIVNENRAAKAKMIENIGNRELLKRSVPIFTTGEAVSEEIINTMNTASMPASNTAAEVLAGVDKTAEADKAKAEAKAITEKIDVSMYEGLAD